MSDTVKPFLKWPGSKFGIIERVIGALPQGQRFIEPFVGSSSVYLNAPGFNEYFLGDVNPDLAILYQSLIELGDQFVELARSYFVPANNNAERYYAQREWFNACDPGVERSCLFLYLNRHGYNGLCRYNSKGGYNVPFGRYDAPYFPEDELNQFLRLAKERNPCFLWSTYRQMFSFVRSGDVVYCDPPYVPLSATASFTAYSGTAFGEDDQRSLAALALKARDAGARVVISNHDTEFTRDIYKGAAEIISFPVRRSISCGERNCAQELIAIF